MPNGVMLLILISNRIITRYPEIVMSGKGDSAYDTGDRATSACIFTAKRVYQDDSSFHKGATAYSTSVWTLQVLCAI